MIELPRLRLLRPAILAAALAMIVAGCTTTVTTAQVTPGASVAATAPVTINANDAVALINDIRAQRGLGRVQLDPLLMQAAERQAQAMAAAGVMSHDVGGSFQSRSRGWNVVAAENIAAGYGSLQAVMNAWVVSPGHYQNLTLRDVTRVGIAVAYNPASPYRNFFALILAGEPARAGVAINLGIGAVWGRAL